MTKKQILEEMLKAAQSPYYYYTHFWSVNGKPATTHLTEEEFNKQFAEIARGKTLRKSITDYEYKDHIYVIESKVKVKNPITREWNWYVIYHRKGELQQYAREEKEFFERFKKKIDGNSQ